MGVSNSGGKPQPAGEVGALTPDEPTEDETLTPDERTEDETLTPDERTEDETLTPDELTKDKALTPDERTELERLRAETAELHKQQSGASRHRRHSWRTPVAVVLIFLGCLLAPEAVLGVWAANQVSDTGRYVANVEPLIHDPAIQNALTDKITNQITSRLNVTGVINQASAQLNSKGLTRISSLLDTFGPQIASSVTGFIHSTVHSVVSSQAFATAWVQVNTVAHGQIVKVLSGQGNSSISVSNGQVVIGLGPFIDIVKKALVDRGFTLANSIPAINPTITLFQARQLERAQSGYRLINNLKIVLPILTLILIAAGVYVARSHRRALIGAGLGFAFAMLFLGVDLQIFRSIYLNSVPNSVLPSDAAAALFDTFVRFIKDALRGLLVVGLVVAAAAFFTGPSNTAVRTRSAFASGLGWIRRTGERRGVSTGPAGLWTFSHRKGLRIGAIALAALIFVFWGQPTAAVVILIVVLLLVVLGLIELIGRPPARPQTAGQP
ncbi:MAG TPA: hypothetical protein VNO25_00385 [Streptosporangiaceae bacterium]|nr:hypothetical protein [Streptosporangiaceae bacterium]